MMMEGNGSVIGRIAVMEAGGRNCVVDRVHVVLKTWTLTKAPSDTSIERRG